MKVNKWLTLPLCIVFLITFTGCAGNYSDYAQAVKEQNITKQLILSKDEAKRADEQRKHEEKMMNLTTNLMTAVASTPDNTDNVLVPLMIMVLEDKWAQSKDNAARNTPPIAASEIKPPETIGETIQKSTSLLLGAAGLYLGIVQSNNMADVAKAGIAGAGTHNTANNGSTVNSGTVTESTLSGSNSTSQDTNSNNYNTKTTNNTETSAE